MILHPDKADRLKNIIDRLHPDWLRTTDTRLGDSPQPPILVLTIDGAPIVVASGSSTEVFGAGHLTVEEWWRPGGIGAPLKGDRSELDVIERKFVTGYIHCCRLAHFFSDAGAAGEFQRFFAEHNAEWSAFLEVEFSWSEEGAYPWRARPRRS